MRYLPKKVITLAAFSSILLIPTASDKVAQAFPAKVNPASDFRVSAVATHLDHPTIFTFDQTGRLIILVGNSQKSLMRLEPSGVHSTLTSPGALSKLSQINTISVIDGKVYLFSPGKISIVKPNGDLDTFVDLKATVKPQPAISDSLVRSLGIDPSGSGVGPDGSTYLTQSLDNGEGVVWRLLKPGESKIAAHSKAELGVFSVSMVMILIALRIIWKLGLGSIRFDPLIGVVLSFYQLRLKRSTEILR